MKTELVTLRECLEAHQDHENLLYLTDIEATLQDINKCIGGGETQSLQDIGPSDRLRRDVLRVIVIKLQRKLESDDPANQS